MTTTVWLAAAGVAIAMLGAMATMLLALWSRIEASQTALRSELGKGLESVRSEMRDTSQEMGNRLESLRSEFGSRLEASGDRLESLRSELGNRLEASTSDLGNRLETLRAETRESMQQLRAENQEAHRSLGDRVEGVRQTLDSLLVELLKERRSA